MHRRKIFIGIEIPTRLRKSIMRATEKWRDLLRAPEETSSARNSAVAWSKEENLHITLAFVGYVTDEIIADMCLKLRELCKNISPFDIQLTSLTLAYTSSGAEHDPQNAKMIWVEGQASDELKNLQQKIAKSLNIFIPINQKTLRPHVTLGRIKRGQWKSLKEIPTINEKINYDLSVDAVTLFESTIVDGKRKYLPLEVCPLGV